MAIGINESTISTHPMTLLVCNAYWKTKVLTMKLVNGSIIFKNETVPADKRVIPLVKNKAPKYIIKETINVKNHCFGVEQIVALV